MRHSARKTLKASSVRVGNRLAPHRALQTAGRLRSKMAEYLLNDLDPSDTLKTIGQLESAFITESKKY